MSIHRFSRIFVGVLWLTAGLAPLAHADDHYVTREEKSFTVSGQPEVTLNTFDGAIQVRSWDKSEVHVTIERRAMSEADAKAIEVDTRQDGNRITVEVRKPAAGWTSWFGRVPECESDRVGAAHRDAGCRHWRRIDRRERPVGQCHTSTRATAASKCTT